MAEKKGDLQSQIKHVGVLTTVPIILLVGPAVGYFLGSWIDRKSHIFPWFTIILTALGFIAAAREITRLLKQILKDDKEN